MQLNQLFKIFLPRIRRGDNSTQLDSVLIKRKPSDKTGFIYHTRTFMVMPAGFNMHNLLYFIMSCIFLVICRQIRCSQVLCQANGLNDVSGFQQSNHSV